MFLDHLQKNIPNKKQKDRHSINLAPEKALQITSLSKNLK